MKLTELNSLIDEFIDSKPLKQNSRRAYKTDLFFFSQFYAAEKFSFTELNKTQLLCWLNQYAPRAAQRRGTNIRRFLLWLSEQKNININAELRLPWQFSEPVPKNPDKAAQLSEEEIEQLLHSYSLNLSPRCLIALLLTTGATLEELAALQWRDLNLGKLAHITLGEAGKARVVPLESHHQIVKLLRELKRQSPEESPVFVTEREGKPMQSAYMAIIIRRATEKVLGRLISPTQIHEYAKQKFFEEFNNIEIVLQMLGKKRAFSLIKVEPQKIDLKRIKELHQKAFEFLG